MNFSKVFILFRRDFPSDRQAELKAQVSKAGLTIVNEPEAAELILCIGGDGTFLRGVEAKARKDTPVLGVNVGGHLGYLTADADLGRALERLQKKEYTIMERTMVSAEVYKEGVLLSSLVAINEIVIRGENNKPVEVDVSMAGASIENVFGDGIIVATPTGSTAYNLSTGGPLVEPVCPILVITPIAPIDLNVRPIIVSDQAVISLKIVNNAGSRKYVFADRQELTLAEGAFEIKVQKARHNLKVVEFPGVKGNFFQILHDRTLGQRKCSKP
ncbi:MAG: NAD(+)/NADH kinase [Candidatus Margulisiibacteriota bacterium]|jgi:NAD+ kinase